MFDMRDKYLLSLLYSPELLKIAQLMQRVSRVFFLPQETVISWVCVFPHESWAFLRDRPGSSSIGSSTLLGHKGCCNLKHHHMKHLSFAKIVWLEGKINPVHPLLPKKIERTKQNRHCAFVFQRLRKLMRPQLKPHQLRPQDSTDDLASKEGAVTTEALLYGNATELIIGTRPLTDIPTDDV